MLRYYLIVCATVCVLVRCQEIEIISNILDSANTPIKVIEADVFLMSKRYVAQAETPVLKLYYESLCPDCIEFDPQFVDVVEKLHKYLDVHTYPYGNARTTKYDNGSVLVECQHGPRECYGNKLHACALDILPCPTQGIYYNGCMIGRRSTDLAADECGNEMKIDGATVNSIKHCAKGAKGQELLIACGVESAKAGFQYVPYVTINGVEWTGKDLLNDVCSAFYNPPVPCTQNKS